MLFLAVVIIIISTLLLYIHWLQTYSKYGKQINKFPGPPTIPILGNLLTFPTNPVNLFKYFRQQKNQYCGTYKLWIANTVLINITTAEDVEKILLSKINIKKAFFYNFIHSWLGLGLITSTSSKWQQRRKLITPAFHFNILRKFIETFSKNSQKLVDDFKKECSKSHTDVTPYITFATLQIIIESSMGTTLNVENKIHQNYVNSLHMVGKFVLYRFNCFWMHNDYIFNILPTGWKYNKLIKSMHEFTSKVIKIRESNFNDDYLKDFDLENEDNIKRRKQFALLDLLIHAKKTTGTIDHEGIQEEIDTFMFAGHDTISSALTFTLLVLASHKDHQEKIVEEMKNIFGNSNRSATYEDLQNMCYLDRCIKEALRMFPSAPLIARHIDEDLQLNAGIAPAGSTVVIHIYDIHYDPKHFPNPHKYDPERFLPENMENRHPFAFIPFSAGSRNCIGQKFAMLEMKCCISTILRNFILEPVDTPDTMTYKFDLILKNSKEVNIRFRPR